MAALENLLDRTLNLIIYIDPIRLSWRSLDWDTNLLALFIVGFGLRLGLTRQPLELIVELIDLLDLLIQLVFTGL